MKDNFDKQFLQCIIFDSRDKIEIKFLETLRAELYMFFSCIHNGHAKSANTNRMKVQILVFIGQ